MNLILTIGSFFYAHLGLIEEDISEFTKFIRRTRTSSLLRLELESKS